MMNNYNFLSNHSKMALKQTWRKRLALLGLFIMFGVLGVNAQVTTNGGSGLAGSYPDLTAAITALNAATITSPVVITVGGAQAAPAGGYSITASGTSTNTITISGGSNTVTASAALTVGNLNDAIFKIIGGDYITIQNFTMQENAGNTVTTAASNTMTEWGVALLYATATDGAQNCTIQNNTISLNRTYANTFGIYANATHTATAVTASASATGATGGNSGLKIYGNNISNVNLGICVVGPTAAADQNNGVDIGGSSVSTGNTISNFGNTGTFSGYANVSGTMWGILVRNSYNYNISYNSVTSPSGNITAGTTRGIYVPSFSAISAATSANTINNNTISLTPGAAVAVTGIGTEGTTLAPAASLSISNNNFTALTYSVAVSSTVIAISNLTPVITTNINGNTFTNLTTVTTGSFTFIGNSVTRPASAVCNANNNSIVTGFNKTGAGGTITYYTSNGTTPATGIETNSGNNFSNVTVTGATTIAGWASTDGSTSAPFGPNKVITNNTFGNVTGGSSPLTLLAVAYSNSTLTNNNVSGNVIGPVTSAGAITGISSVTASQNFFNNTVSGLASSGASVVTGISITGGVLQNVYNNKIYDLSGTNAGSTVNGILITGLTSASTGTANVYNNLIGDLRTPAGLGTDIIRGISITSTSTTTNVNLYYNTIYLNGTSSAANFGTSGIFHTANATASTSTLTMRNNIIFNNSTPAGTGVTVAYRRSAGTAGTLANYASASNNNLFYAGTPGAARLIYSDGTSTAQTLAAYKSGVFTAGTIAPRDSNSISESPTFLSTSGSNANFLHIDPAVATLIEGGGIAISGITTDYDGNTRNAVPDIGADEFAGTTPAPVITLNSVTPPTTPFCTATSRVVSVNVTVTTGTITGVVLNYSFNGVAQSAVIMTNTVGTTWTGTIPAAVPSTATIAWSVVATSSVPLSTTYIGTSYTDEQNTGATATASPNPVCDGSSLVLTGSVTSPGLKTVGAGASSTATYPGAFYSLFSNVHTQHLITAAELTAAGLRAGNITSVALNVSSAGTLPMIDLSVKIGATSATSMTAFASNAGFSTVFTSASYMPTTGLNTLTFSTPFAWNGTSNIILEFCHGNPSSTATMSRTVVTDPTSFVSTVKTHATVSTSSATICGDTTTNLVSYSERPQFTFAGNGLTTPTAISWTDANNNVVGTTNPLTIAATTPGVYTFSATANGCPITATTPSVTITPAPTAPTATNSSQCGLQIPTASVADPNGFTTPTFKWYSASTGGTALQSSTSTTYATAISTTTTFHVSVTNPTTGCESTRTAVTITVASPDAIDATTNHATICLGESFDLTATNIAGTPVQNYTYSWSSTTGSGASSPVAGSPVTITPTASGTYVYTVTGTDGSCSTTDTVSVTVSTLPNIIASATATTICAGSSTTLSAVTGTIATGTVTFGTDNAPTKINTTGVPYRTGTTVGNEQKVQYLIFASELTAAGIQPGNITSVGFTVVTGNTGVMTNLDFKMANVATTALTTTFVVPTFTNVLLIPTYTPVIGLNTHTLSTPFVWDGTSNVLLQVCGKLTTGGSGCTMATFTTPVITTVAVDAATGCVSTTGSTIANARPVITFGGQILTSGAGSLTYTWNPGNVTGSSITVSPTTTTLYSVSGFNPATGCTGTNTINITVNPQPTAPTGTDSSQCGAAVPTASVMDTNGFTTPTFKWYSAPTGGTVLQSSTSTTFTSSIAATTTFHVAVVNPTTLCESARTPVTVTFTAADPVTITPSSTTPCANAAFTLGASSVNAGYTYTWTASPAAGSGILTSMTGSSISVTPTSGGTYIYTASATDGSCVASNTVSINVIAPSVVATASPANICLGSSSTLTAVAGGPGSASPGAGGSTSNTYPGAFYSLWSNVHTQHMVTAAELLAAGIQAGNLTSVALDVTSAGSLPMIDLSVKIGATSTSTMGSFISNAGFTTVFTSASYMPTVGANTLTFSTPFYWDGTSNIVLEFCHGNPSSGATMSRTVTTDVTAFVSTAKAHVSSGTAASVVCGDTTTNFLTYSERPHFTFTGTVAVTGGNPLTYTWNPGNLSGSTVIVTPATTTTYTVSALDTVTGCTTIKTVVVNVGALPTAPVGTDSAQCGVKVPTASVSDPNGFTTPTFKWYADNVTTTALQSGTSTTYTTAIGATTTFYVSVINPITGCESTRTPVTVTYTAPDAIVRTPGATASGCVNQALVLSVSSANTNYVYTWTASPAAGSGIATSVTGAAPSITPTASGTYVYTIAASDGNCTTSTTITATINVAPSAVVINQTGSQCVGQVKTLTATGGYAPATGTVGTATTLTTANGLEPTAFNNRYEQFWMQTVYTAADLTAAGVTAGPITSIAYNITTLGDAATNPLYEIRIGTTANSVLTAFQTTGLNLVYGPVTQTHAIGVNTINFSTPYIWDGVSNIIVDLRHEGVDSANNAQTYYTATAGNTVILAMTSTASSVNTVQALVAANTVAPAVQNSNKRLNTTFGFTANVSMVWSPTTDLYTNVGGTTPYTGQSTSVVYANPTAETTYTATASLGGCSTSGNITVTPVALPEFTVAGATICKGGSTTLNAVGIGNAYAWSPSTGLSATSGASITANPLSTITYTVIATNNTTGCQSTETVTVTVNDPVTINSITPLNPSAIDGQQVIFTVDADGTGLTYQWYESPDGVEWNLLAGETGTTLTVTADTDTNNGYQYHVEVSGAAPCPTETSASATLTIDTTGITGQPQDLTVCAPNQATFVVTATSEDEEAVITYGWEVSTDDGGSFIPVADGADNTVVGYNFTGSDTGTLVLTSTTPAADGWIFHAIVNGYIFSSDAELTVKAPVTITTTTIPDQTVCAGNGTATFAVVATGDDLTYQWEVSTNGGTSWSNVTNGGGISGATTATLSIVNPAIAANNNQYRVVVTGNALCSSATSTAATLHINNTIITSQPANAIVVIPDTAVFTVATSSASPTYQWQYATTVGGSYTDVVNGTPAGVIYTGANTASLSVATSATTPPGTNYFYKAVVTSNSCPVSSSAAQMDVRDYCIPTYAAGPGTVDNIANVTLGTLSNTTGSSTVAPYYTFYNNVTIPTITQLSNAVVSVTFGADTANYSGVWIDFNHNGIFETTEGVVATATTTGVTTSGGITTYTIPVPLTAIVGQTRMRVRGGDDNPLTLSMACGATADPEGDGETEDYIVDIVAAPACSGNPTAATASASPSVICISGSAVLTASNIQSGVTGISIQWYNSAGLIAGATNTTYTTPVLTSPETYYVRTICANGSGFTDSAPVTVTVNNPQILTTTPATRCGTGTVTLGATATAGSTIQWYTAASGGTLLGTGPSFTTPTISSTATYYAGASILPASPTATVGAGNTTSTTYDGMFYSLWSNIHEQILFTAADLTAAGLQGGNINSIAINVTSAGTLPMLDFSLKMATTSATSMAAFVSPSFTTVYTNASLMPVVGTNTLTFSTPFYWDGASNIVIEVCHGNAASSATMSRTVTTNATPYVSVIKTHVSAATAAATVCGNTTSNPVTYSSRPQMIFGQSGCPGTRTAVTATVTPAPALSLSSTSATACAGVSTSVVNVTSPVANFNTYTWSPAAGVSGTAATGFTFNGTTTTTFTLTATDAAGCANTATFTLTVNPAPVNFSVTPTTASICANGPATLLTAVGGYVPGATAYTELMNALPATFGIVNTSGTGTAVLNTTYFSEGTGSVRFNTTSTSANVSYAMNTNVNLGDAGSAELTFSHIIGMEGNINSYDIGYVEYSSNGGSTWTTFPTSSYAGSGTLITTQATATPVSGVIFSNKSYAAWGTQFTGTGSTPGTGPATALWRTETVSVPAAALTSQFRIRFRYTTDGSTNYYGWLIDNVKITKTTQGNVIWAPTAGLYTDAGATNAYNGGAAATVYAKPASTTTYVATVANAATGCLATASTVITANPTPTATAPSTMDLCAGMLTTPVALAGTPSGVTFDISGGASVGLSNQANVTSIPAFTAIPGNATVTVTPKANGCTGNAVTFLIKVSPPTVGGSLSGGTTICAGSSSALLTLSGHTGNVIRWESSVSPFSVWSPIANTATTYTSGALTQTTQFRAVVQSGTCQEVASSATTVTVNVVTLASVTASDACPNTMSIISLNGMAPNSTSTVGYTKSGVGQAPVSVTASASGVGSFSVLISAAGQTIVITSITRTDVSPNCPFTPTSGNSATPVFSTQCSQVQTCGITLPTIDTQIVANLVANAQGYRWRVTNLTGPNTSQVQTTDTPLRTMKLTNLPSYAFATQYNVEVATLRNGVWGPFSSGCTVVTPSATTNLTNCNLTLTTLGDVVYANIVPFAGGYRFRITDPVNATNTQVIERPIREFKMTMITAFAVQYGKTYNVEVGVKNTDGTYMAYGTVCQLSTPVFPTTSLQDSQCEDYMVPSATTQIYAFSYPGAIGYAFLLTGPGLPVAGVEVVKPVRTFSLSDFAGAGLIPGATYNVKVRLIFNLGDPAGPYGKTCTIVTPGAGRIVESKVQFNAIAFPNPFAEDFSIEVATSLDQNIGVKVYDMTGRLLETREVKISDIESLQIGQRYPSGVYNVIVTQGDNVKTLRVIKR
jgi:hypothetical protein